MVSSGSRAASTFVLVHGVSHGGWCYDRVAKRLRAEGHRVLAPTLAGLAERSSENSRRIDLTTHVNDIMIDAPAQLADILCGLD